MCSNLFRLSNLGARQESDMVAVRSYLSGSVSPCLGSGTTSQLPLVLNCRRNSSVHGGYLCESTQYFYTRNMAHMQQTHTHGRFAHGQVLKVLATVRSK